MSKIKFEQISEDVVEVFIPAETPMDMVQQLTKSLTARGLVEDQSNSTLSVRYFYRPDDKANALADQLIKSLENLAKDDADKLLPHWHPKAQIAHQKRLREKEIAERRAKLGVTNVSHKPSANVSPKPKPIGHIPHDDPSTAGGTGRRYAYINDPVNKMEEHASDCDCGKCEEIEKSGYGPKGMSQYNPADNARRKMNNTGDMTGLGPNVNTKAYSTKPGQLSGKAQADITSRIQAAANKKQPVRQWTPEQIAAENAKRGLKKGWGQHLPFPSAEEEIMKLAAMDQTVKGEDAMATQLANFMAGKSMLGTAPPPQPTDEQMFGHLVVTEEVAKAAEQKWQGAAFDWLKEAAKPISQKFASEEEEMAYWNSIKVTDSDDGRSGY